MPTASGSAMLTGAFFIGGPYMAMAVGSAGVSVAIGYVLEGDFLRQYCCFAPLT